MRRDRPRCRHCVARPALEIDKEVEGIAKEENVYARSVQIKIESDWLFNKEEKGSLKRAERLYTHTYGWARERERERIELKAQGFVSFGPLVQGSTYIGENKATVLTRTRELRRQGVSEKISC